jgi:hypothetical protein
VSGVPAKAITGGCFCGFVRYETTGTPFEETICHCSICRRTTGAPFVAWFSVPPATFRITAGEPASVRSSSHGTRTFCPRCGTQLTFRSTDFPGEIDVTTSSLDDPERLPPKDHTHTSAQLSWIALGDGLRRYRGAHEH